MRGCCHAAPGQKLLAPGTGAHPSLLVVLHSSAAPMHPAGHAEPEAIPASTSLARQSGAGAVHKKNRSGALSARQLRKYAQRRQPAGYTVHVTALHQPPWAPTATMITASAIAKAGSAWLASDSKALGRAGESSFQGVPHNQKGSKKFRQMGPRTACQCFARRPYRNEARRESR